MSRFGKSRWWPGECLHREELVHSTKKLWWLILNVNPIGLISALDVSKAYFGCVDEHIFRED